jgi:hypothetical protein
VPVYLDGMVRSVCSAYQNQSHDLHPSLQRFLANARRPLFTDPDLHIFSVRSTDRLALLARTEPMVIISSSGMLAGGASPLYATTMANHEQDCILFSGYQDEESPGYALLNAKRGDALRIGDQPVLLQCQVARYNLSGHADGEQILHVIQKVQPGHVILVHGVPEALGSLAGKISKREVLIPKVGEMITFSPKASISHALRSGIALVSQQEIEPPTIEILWKMAVAKGPMHPWTAVELGQQYYGSAYHPEKRQSIEHLLKEASPYFAQRRLGAQAVYLPKKAQEVTQIKPNMQCVPGEIVLAQ